MHSDAEYEWHKCNRTGEVVLPGTIAQKWKHRSTNQSQHYYPPCNDDRLSAPAS